MASESAFPSIPPSSGLKWSPEAAASHAQKHKFIRVGGASIGSRFLSGATRSWAQANPSENQSIFNLEYRITGTPDDVRTALSRAGVSQEDIDRAIEDSITSENYQTTKAQEYEAELDTRKSKEKKEEPQPYDWLKIVEYCAGLLGEAKIGKKGVEQTIANAPATRPRTNESLGDKARKLSGTTRVIDVSDMDVLTGKTIRMRDRPSGAKNKLGKFGDSGNRVPFISNNIDKYIAALKLAYGNDAETVYAAEIEDVRNKLQVATGLQPAPVGHLPAVSKTTKGKTAALPPPPVAGSTVAAAPTVKPAPKATVKATVKAPAKAAVKAPAKPAALPPAIKTPPSRVSTRGGAGYPAIPPLKGAH